MEVGRESVDGQNVGTRPDELLLTHGNAIFEGAKGKMIGGIRRRIELRMQLRKTRQHLVVEGRGEEGGERKDVRNAY